MSLYCSRKARLFLDKQEECVTVADLDTCVSSFEFEVSSFPSNLTPNPKPETRRRRTDLCRQSDTCLPRNR